ncbi:MAG TPA: hypothetical protein VLK65_10230 [Vicinamibacteria bacterium]|nr:hypothetical protein [Vicinamibacteria bacterium]
MSTKSARFAIAGAFAAVLGLACLPKPATAADSALRIHWSDQRGYLRDKLVARGYDTMAREVSAILHDAGVEVEWTPLIAEPSDGVVVVLTPSDGSRWGLPSGTLGAVMGRGGPVSCVFVPAVARLLGVRRTRSARDFHELGKAIGRVAAHEIVHAITPGFPHTPEGLMVAHLTRGDLRRNDLRLSASAAAAFHHALKLRDQANTKP